MADYWKSQPKKFCQYCKCWIADNKPSVEFHERGKNHKENVAAKISEIKKKSMDKLKQDEKNCKEFAAMEAAAMKAYEEDLKRMQLESGTAEVPTASPSPPPSQPKSQPKSQPQSQHQSQPKSQHQSQPQRREKKGKRSENDGSAVSRTQSPVWLQGKSDDGHMYYYNTQTGESKWENPEGFQGECSDSTQTGQSENSTGGGWKNAVSPEGHTYYYNTATGETRWERPADFSADASGPGPQDESQPEPPGTSSPAPAAQEPEGNGQDGQQPKGPTISFRKRKADTESTEKEEDGHSDSGDEKEDDDEEEEKEQEEASNEEAMKTEEEEEKPKEGEVKEEQEGAHAKREEVERKAKKPRKTTPYGAWEQIQEEEDPYDNVDLQLPQMEGMEGIPIGLDELPPEPKPKFRERTITSLGDEGGPAAFKKSRALNGRARSIRQRVEDD